MDDVFAAISPVFALLAFGAILRAFGPLPQNAGGLLIGFAMHGPVPAAVFLGLHGAFISVDRLRLPAVSAGVVIVSMSVSHLLGRAVGLEPWRRWELALAAGVANTGFLGYPIALELYGQTGLELAILYDTALPVVLIFALSAAYRANQLLTATSVGVGVHSLQALSPATPRPGVVAFLRRSPIMWAVLAGLAMRPIGLPHIVAEPLELLAAAMTPLVMVGVGMTLTVRELRGNLGFALTAASIRLAIVPAAVLGLAPWLGLRDGVMNAAVVQAGMPTAVFATVLAGSVGLPVDGVNTAMTVSTLLMLVSLPIFVVLL